MPEPTGFPISSTGINVSPCELIAIVSIESFTTVSASSGVGPSEVRQILFGPRDSITLRMSLSQPFREALSSPTGLPLVADSKSLP